MAKNKVKVINYEIPETGKKVPIQMGDIKAAPGCFLGIAAVFEDWDDAKESGYNVSRVFEQYVGAKKHPCYMHDFRFEDYKMSTVVPNMYKADEKKKLNRPGAASLEELRENGFDVAVEYDSTSSEATGSIMEHEVDDALAERDPRLVSVNRMKEAGYTAKEIAEATGIGKWTVYDLLNRIREEKKKYWNK